MSFSALPYDGRYSQVALTDTIRGIVVKLVTDIFQSGGMEVLIGTKSLLGEGWDAPALNSLILASGVGSFILSNQMRGRAIRTLRGNGQKTGNIWHLACVDLTSSDGGADVEMLRRRFRGFVGVSCLEKGGIENGVQRLGLPDNMLDWEALKQFNRQTLALAADRTGLAERWRKGLEQGVGLVEEIKIPERTKYRQKVERMKRLYLNRTIANLTACLCSGLASFGIDILKTFYRSRPRTMEDIRFMLIVFGCVGVVVFGRKLVRVLKLYLRYRDITKDICDMGIALLRTLVKMGVVKTAAAELSVSVEQDAEGSVYCHLSGGTNYEKSIFTEAMSEAVSVIDNPRYLILRKSRILFYVSQVDYHAVPEVLGRKKEWAAYFASCWQKQVRNTELVFTRSPAGRKVLLKARMEALSAYFAEDVEKVSKWK